MNNLGGMSELEMHILGRKAIQWLGEYDHYEQKSSSCKQHLGKTPGY